MFIGNGQKHNEFSLFFFTWIIDVSSKERDNSSDYQIEDHEFYGHTEFLNVSIVLLIFKN